MDSKSWALEQNYLKYPCDRVIWSPNDGVVKRDSRWRAIVQAAKFADVIHFNFGSSLAYPVFPSRSDEKQILKKLARRLFSLYTNVLQAAELSLYRLLRIPMFVHYQGDDARQGDVSLAKFRINTTSHVEAGYYDATSDRFKGRMIQRMARYCEAIYAVNPDLLHVLPSSSKFVPYCHISLGDWKPIYPNPHGKEPLRIGHAPSHRQFKGTKLVIEAVEALRAEGRSLEFKLVEGMSQDEARKHYESMDVLVDQSSPAGTVGWRLS